MYTPQNSINPHSENMTLDKFETMIIKEYTNKLLSFDEIKSICTKAIEYKLIEKSDININEIPKGTTEDLLKFIKRCRNLYLNTDISLDNNSFISAKYHSPISQDIRNSPFYNHKKELLKNENKKDVTLFNSPLISKNNNIENPFENNNDLISFCEDLRTKTKSIKKNASDKTSKLVEEVIDSFLQYKMKKKKRRKYLYITIFLIITVIVIYCNYNSMPI